MGGSQQKEIQKRGDNDTTGKETKDKICILRASFASAAVMMIFLGTTSTLSSAYTAKHGHIYDENQPK